MSTLHQNLARQIAMLKAAGCRKIFTEKQSGRNTKNRPQLRHALAALTEKDVFVVAEWDRATRSMMDGLNLMMKVHQQGATIKVLDRTGLDLTTPIGRAVLGVISAIAEEERERTLARAAAGRREARRRQVRFGRKPKLKGPDVEVARELLRSGLSYRAVARKLGVHHQTISRIG